MQGIIYSFPESQISQRSSFRKIEGLSKMKMGNGASSRFSEQCSDVVFWIRFFNKRPVKVFVAFVNCCRGFPGFLGLQKS